MRKHQPPLLLLACACLSLIIGLGVGSGHRDTITLRSNAATLAAALGPGAPSDTVLSRLDTSDIDGLTFSPVESSFGTFTPIPPGAPAGTRCSCWHRGCKYSTWRRRKWFFHDDLYSAKQLSLASNCRVRLMFDDLGRVFLDGTAISPSIFSNDPGKVTEFGNATFSAQDATLFHPGTNVILISDANSLGGPSGGAFFMAITFVTLHQ